MIRELTVSEKRSPWDATPEWPPDFDSSIEELDFSVNTLEFRYERTCSNARSHVTDLWCIVCPSDYACTDEEGSISDLRTSVIALNPPMHKQSRLPDSGVTTRSSIDDAIWPLPETTFRRSFWNAAGLQVVAAPGRVWCEGRYYDFDDPLPMVAGTHFLASTQSEDNSTYTDWSDDESNGEETEAADDDSSMLQINSDQYQTCVKCSEDLGSPPILQWRPNPQLQQPFDEVVPDVRTGPNGHEIVGTIQPPPNWASTPMFRAAAASGACRRGPDGHLVVHIRSWYVAHNGLCIHQPRDFAMRPQLLVRLTNALRRTWRDHLPGHETITARAVRPSPVDSDATRRFHIIAEINRPVRTDLNPILIAIREITSGGVSVPSWCTALLPTHMGSVDLYQACRPSCRLHQFLIPVGGNLRRWLTPYHARVISPGLFIPCWYDRRLQPVQQPIYETEDDNTELMQRVAVSASSTPQQTPSSTASSSGTVLIHGFRMSAEHRLVVLDPGSQTTYFHQLQEAWKAPKHDQLIDYHLVASPPRDLTYTGDSVFVIEWTTDRNRQAVQSDQLILLDIILTDDDPGAAPHTIRRVVWTRHMMSRQGILHLTSSAAICDGRGTECHLHINHRLWTPDDVMLRQIAHGDYVCLQIRGTSSTTTVELQVELCEQESADSQRYLFQPSPQKSPTTPPEELEGPESEHTNGTDRSERSRSPHRRHDEQNEGISFLQLTATKKLSGRSSWRMRDDLIVGTTSARHWFQLRPWISPRQTNGGLIEPWVYVVITTFTQTLFTTTCNVSHGWRVCSFDGLTGQRCEHSLDVGDSGLSGCRHDLVRRPTRSQRALLGGSSSKLHSERNVVAALFEQYSCVSTDCGGPVWLDPLTGLPPPGNGKWTFVDLRSGNLELLDDFNISNSVITLYDYLPRIVEASLPIQFVGDKALALISKWPENVVLPIDATWPDLPAICAAFIDATTPFDVDTLQGIGLFVDGSSTVCLEDGITRSAAFSVIIVGEHSASLSILGFLGGDVITDPTWPSYLGAQSQCAMDAERSGVAIAVLWALQWEYAASFPVTIYFDNVAAGCGAHGQWRIDPESTLSILTRDVTQAAEELYGFLSLVLLMSKVIATIQEMNWLTMLPRKLSLAKFNRSLTLWISNLLYMQS